MTNPISVLPTIEIEPSMTARYTIITLHGLGADGNDFVPVIKALNLPEKLAVRFVFPHAPVIPITLNNGYQMRAWYDIVSLAFDNHIDLAGIKNSIRLVEQLIEKEIARGIKSSHIILAGFSQGAAIALTTGLQYHQPLAGIIALSGYLPDLKTVLQHIHSANHDTPIFMGHGIHDPIIPYALGFKTAQALIDAGLSVTFKRYNVLHSVCPTEIGDISDWIGEIWSEQSAPKATNMT